ncbi:hypothetical protein pb186bvf_017997 [Paramecium bursaria]
MLLSLLLVLFRLYQVSNLILSVLESLSGRYQQVKIIIIDVLIILISKLYFFWYNNKHKIITDRLIYFNNKLDKGDITFTQDSFYLNAAII